MERNIKDGNCYVASEALYHLLGGRAAGWTPHVMRIKSGTYGTHWFLKHESGLILDPTAQQFGNKKISYELARGTGFLTRRPSARAAALMEKILWQESKGKSK